MMQAPNGKKKKLIIAATLVLALPTSLMMLHHFTSLQDLPSSGNSEPIPGPDPSDAQDGNSSSQSTNMGNESATDAGSVSTSGSGTSGSGTSGSGTASSGTAGNATSASNTSASHNTQSSASSVGGSGNAQSASNDTPSAPIAPGTPSVAKAAPAAKGILQGTFSRFMGLFGGSARTPAGSSGTDSGVVTPGMPLGTGAISNSLIGKEKAPSGGSLESTGEPTGATALLPTEPQQTDGCVTVTFRHKKTSGHADEESCSQHKNLIRIKHLHPTSVCIRVNRTPVAYETVKGKTNEFIIGAVAGPRAEITARYCFGKSVCKEDCTVPKDDFMNAIGGGGGDTPSKQVAQWDANDTVEKDSDVNGHLDAAIKREMDRLDEQTQEASLFQDWLQGPESPACGSRRVAGSLSTDG